MCCHENRMVQCLCGQMLGFNQPTEIELDDRLAGVLKANLSCADCGKAYTVEYHLWGAWAVPVKQETLAERQKRQGVIPSPFPRCGICKYFTLMDINGEGECAIHDTEVTGSQYCPSYELYIDEE